MLRKPVQAHQWQRKEIWRLIKVMNEDSLNFANTPDVLEEPNLLELKKMVIDVHISVSSILREQKNIITEIASPKESIQSKAAKREANECFFFCHHVNRRINSH